MPCECQSGRRILRLTAPDLRKRYPELIAFVPGNGWLPSDENDAVQTVIGAGGPWATVRELVNFLRAIIDEQRLSKLEAQWPAGKDCSLTNCGAQAVPVPEFAPLDSTPLVSLLRERRIETWFQPVFTSEKLELWGYECLMRGRDENGELIMPNQILDWAQQERLTFMLDRICRETHIENAGNALHGRNVRVLINFLPTAIYEPSFCLRTTTNAAEKSGLTPAQIIFEVVESEQVDDCEHLASVLGYYRRAGFGVALDDVGSGYSGLMMLADLVPDLIKIDRALVVKAVTSKMHSGICRALCTLAHDAGKLALAEGVETIEQWQTLAELGADLFQGYLFGKPAAQPAPESLVQPAMRAG